MLFNNMLLVSGSSVIEVEAPTGINQFGQAAVLSADDNYMAVYGNYYNASTNLSDGAISIYTMNGPRPTFQQTILPVASGIGGNNTVDFGGIALHGTCYALDGTGTRLLVGAEGQDFTGATNAGAMYVYTRSGSTWSQEAELLPASNVSSQRFGSGVALSSAGDVAVGTNGFGDASVSKPGGGVVFTRSGTTWTRRATLAPSVNNANDAGSLSAAISPDGGTIAIGYHNDRGPNNTHEAGTVNVWKGSGSSWTLSQSFSGTTGGTELGLPVRFADDNTLVVGAADLDVNGNNNAGGVYVYTRSNTSSNFGTPPALLTAPTPKQSGFVGFHLGAASGGEYIVAGAEGLTADGLHVWRKQSGTWSHSREITAPASWAADGLAANLFATDSDPAISSDGSFVAYGHPDAASLDGRLYIFT